MDKRISDLTSVSSLNNNDVFAVVNNNETKKVSFENLKESLPGASQSTTNNAYLVPVRITVQDGDSINLTGSTYENTSMGRSSFFEVVKFTVGGIFRDGNSPVIIITIQILY